MLIFPSWFFWLLTWLTVNTGSRLSALSDCANITNQCEPFGIAFGPPVSWPGLAGSDTSGGVGLLDWYQTISTLPASPAAIHGKIDVPVPELTLNGP